MYNYPYFKTNLFSRMFGNTPHFSWSGFLDGTQKTLGVINQAIPIVNQVKPVISNAKTLFKIADEINSPSTINKNASSIPQSYKNNNPTFYI